MNGLDLVLRRSMAVALFGLLLSCVAVVLLLLGTFGLVEVSPAAAGLLVLAVLLPHVWKLPDQAPKP